MRPTSQAHQIRPQQDDVLAGLMAPVKSLPCRLLYDQRGAELFEQITELDEYYPTRSELALLETQLPTLAARLGPAVRVVEPGSGDGRKARMLLDQLTDPAGYVPIDISAEQLAEYARTLGHEFPMLDIQPIAADFTAEFTLPVPNTLPRRTLMFFPGSTIGNFEPADAQRLLARWAKLAGRGGRLLLGADANRNVDSLVPAYDDARGLTQAFNRNILVHVNRTHAATFDPEAFTHRAVWNATYGRIEMHLVSRRAQSVRVLDRAIELARGEPIVTEHCYKYTREMLDQLLARAGWQTKLVVADSQRRMHLWLAASTAT